MNTALQKMGGRLSVSEEDLKNIIMNTIMPSGGRSVTNEQFIAFVSVANEYKLNPLTREVYAFPAKGGGIQPIVSIDGWMKIINSHPDFDGMEFMDNNKDGKLISITCRIHRKSLSHPIEVTEYLVECSKSSDPWRQWPNRMLRHKAAIQAARYAFGFSGIIDPDEGDRFAESGVIEKEINKDFSGEADIDVLPEYPHDTFDEKLQIWLGLIDSGKSDPEQIIAKISTKYSLSNHQEELIRRIEDENN